MGAQDSIPALLYGTAQLFTWVVSSTLGSEIINKDLHFSGGPSDGPENARRAHICYALTQSYSPRHMAIGSIGGLANPLHASTCVHPISSDPT